VEEKSLSLSLSLSLAFREGFFYLRAERNNVSFRTSGGEFTGRPNKH